MFEDFSIGDLREVKDRISGYEIEKNTYEKSNGIICHYFDKDELMKLFSQFSKIEIKERENGVIRGNDKVKRRVISAVIC